MTVPFTPGELVDVAEADSLARVIAHTELTSPAANFDVSGIDNAYTNLLLELVLRTTAANRGCSWGIGFNGDTAANYDWAGTALGPWLTTRLFDNGSTVEVAGVASPAPGANARTARFAVYSVFIGAYSSTSIEKSAHLTGGYINYQDGDVYFGNWVGGWRSAAAIDRITVTPFTGSWAPGSRMTVYGLGAV